MQPGLTEDVHLGMPNAPLLHGAAARSGFPMSLDVFEGFEAVWRGEASLSNQRLRSLYENFTRASLGERQTLASWLRRQPLIIERAQTLGAPGVLSQLANVKRTEESARALLLLSGASEPQVLQLVLDEAVAVLPVRRSLVEGANSRVQDALMALRGEGIFAQLVPGSDSKGPRLDAAARLALLDQRLGKIFELVSSAASNPNVWSPKEAYRRLERLKAIDKGAVRYLNLESQLILRSAKLSDREALPKLRALHPNKGFETPLQVQLYLESLPDSTQTVVHNVGEAFKALLPDFWDALEGLDQAAQWASLTGGDAGWLEFYQEEDPKLRREKLGELVESLFGEQESLEGEDVLVAMLLQNSVSAALRTVFEKYLKRDLVHQTELQILKARLALAQAQGEDHGSTERP